MYCTCIIIFFVLYNVGADSAALFAPSIACSGDILTVSWKGITSPDKSKDYIGFWQPLNSTVAYKFSNTTTGKSDGSVNFTKFSIDPTLGPGEFRYCHNDDKSCSHSKPENLAAVSAPITACKNGKLIAPDIACTNATVWVSWTNIQHPGEKDYIAFWQPSNSSGKYSKYWQWARDGKENGSVAFTNFIIDEKLGDGEFRYCRNNDDYCGPSKQTNLAATSGPIRAVSNCSIRPQQIHLSWGSSPDTMVVTWTTTSLTCSKVQFGLDKKLSKSATGIVKKFIDDGGEHRVQYIHNAILTGLLQGTKYYYRCGCDVPDVAINELSWSDIYDFRAMRTGNDIDANFIVLGDLGVSNDKSMSYLESDASKNFYDAVLHVGDFAYDMASDNARIGDTFMNLIQPIAARHPYMVCVGNHENAYNFSHYRNRFSMPDERNQTELNSNMWFSFNMGPIHFISWSSEVFYWDDQKQFIEEQRAWLEADLKEANSPENREKHPWIITLVHRPMYCSYKKAGEDCTPTGKGTIRKYAEDLYYQYGVDIGFWAHEHNYERFFPAYQGKFGNGSYRYPYTNPKASIHITSGTAGCREGHDAMTDPWGDLSAFRSEDYGYAHLHVYNKTHLHWEEISIDKKGEVLDSIWVIQESHGPFNGSLSPANPYIRE